MTSSTQTRKKKRLGSRNFKPLSKNNENQKEKKHNIKN